MKNLTIVFLSVMIISFFLNGCKSNSTDTSESTTTQGSYFVSTPPKAEIWIDGINTGQVTPYLVDTISVGTHTITFKVADYDTLSFSKTVTLSTVDTVKKTLTTSLYTAHSTVSLYAYPGVCGLNLATGNTYLINDAAKSTIDLYYTGEVDTLTTYVYSSSKNSNLLRATYFKLSVETILANGTDSDTFSATDTTWVTSFPLYGTTVFYVYDNDRHYSKVLLTGQGTGFIEMTWLYNKTADNPKF